MIIKILEQYKEFGLKATTIEAKSKVSSFFCNKKFLEENILDPRFQLNNEYYEDLDMQTVVVFEYQDKSGKSIRIATDCECYLCNNSGDTMDRFNRKNRG